MVERKLRLAPQITKTSKTSLPKLFVLDTNVLMHDPTSLFRFEEHDLYLPILTLEELDNNKKGVTEVARNARQASRYLDELVTAAVAISGGNIAAGIPLKPASGGAASGRLFLQTEAISTALPPSLAGGKADNQIIAVVMHLQRMHPKRSVILVSKDINMRIKAHAVGIAAEDYFNDKVLEDTDLLYSGMRELPADFWDRHGKGMESWQQGGHTYYRVTGPLCNSLLINEFVYQEAEGPGRDAAVRHRQGGLGAHRAAADPARLYASQEQRVGHHRAQSRAEFRAQPAHEPGDRLRDPARSGRHRQDPAHARRGPDDDAGVQGLFRDHHDARHRAGRRGHRLPAGHRGREDEPVDGCARGQPRRAQQDRRRGRRMGPRRDARPDPLAHQGEIAELHARPHLHQQVPDHRRGAEPYAQADEDADHARRARAPRSCVSATSRRSTRPYLTEGSSGLTYVVDRFKGWSHSGHITLLRGERSRLADRAAEIL